MFKLGVTGGIGSGKSTVARMLEDLGAFLIDADQLSHQLTQAGGAAIAQIQTSFGADYLTPEGALNRQKMRECVYADPAARRQLETIMHPLVALLMQHQEALAHDSGHVCTVYDIPLLTESNRWRRVLHSVLVVDCLESTQIHRVMQRNLHSSQMIEKIMAAQTGRHQRLRAADLVLYNDGLDLIALRQQLSRLAPLFGL